MWESDGPCATSTRCRMSNKQSRRQRRGSFAAANSLTAWLDAELADCDFADKRLASRFRSVLERLAAKPGGSLPLACQDWANTKGAYRFLDNERVSEAQILAGHFEATRSPPRRPTARFSCCMIRRSFRSSARTSRLWARPESRWRVPIATGLRGGTRRAESSCTRASR